MIDVNVKLDNFEGPVGLLYRLIEKNEIDIYDIPIAELADQYLSVISAFPPDMESLSSFLVMAAALLEIKSRLLLPSANKAETKEEIDPREELVRRLLEYKRFKDISEILKQREISQKGIVFKEADENLLKLMNVPKATVDELLDGVGMEKLVNVFMEALNRKELKVDKIRSSFGTIVKDEYTVENSMERIRSVLRFGNNLSFFDIFKRAENKPEMISTFMALLELIRLKEIRIRQDRIFEDIIIFKVI